MRIETIQIQIEKNGAFKKTDHTAELTAYLQDSGEECRIQKRPAVVICPGGGYEFCSFREGEPVALELLSKGYQTFVLRYSTAPDSFPTALLELAGAVAMVRLRAAEWNIIPEQVAVMGFSAGGHLAASLGVFWNQEFLSALVKRQVQFPAGDNFRRDFLWHTFTDTSVPAENSLLFLSALKKAGVSAEAHLFPEGRHGLALADERTDKETSDGRGSYVEECCKPWAELAEAFLERWRRP